MKKSFTVVAAFMVASILPALADQTVDIEGARIILVAPVGQCFLDKTDAVQKQVDERMAAAVRSVHYLATSVPCNWKPTSADEDSGTYAVWSAVPEDNGSAVVPSRVGRRALLDEVTQEAMPTAADLNKKLERFKAERDMVAVVGQPAPLGRDENAFYMGLKIELGLSGQQKITRSGVSAFTMAQGRFVSMSFYKRYSEGDIPPLLEQTKATMATFVKTND
jgi:hypothetical protein